MAGLPGVPLVTGIFTIVSLLVLATKSAVSARLKTRPLAPKGGTPCGSGAGARRGLVTQATAGPPPAPVFQMIPPKESEMYTFPAASKVRTLGPAPAGNVVKGLAAPVKGFTRRT